MNKAIEYLVTTASQTSIGEFESLGYRVGNRLFVHKGIAKDNKLFRIPTTNEYKILSEFTISKLEDGQEIREIDL